MDTCSLCHVECLLRHLSARRSVGNICDVVICVLENAGKNVHLSSVKGLSRRNLNVVIASKSLAGSFQKVVDAKKRVVLFWSVDTPALETVANASKEGCTFLAKQIVKEDEFVFTSAKSLAQRTVHRVLINVKTDVSTAGVPNNAWNLAHHAGNDVPGSALTSSVRSSVVKNATVLDVTNHAGRDY